MFQLEDVIQKGPDGQPVFDTSDLIGQPTQPIQAQSAGPTASGFPAGIQGGALNAFIVEPLSQIKALGQRALETSLTLIKNPELFTRSLLDPQAAGTQLDIAKTTIIENELGEEELEKVAKGAALVGGLLTGAAVAGPARTAGAAIVNKLGIPLTSKVAPFIRGATQAGIEGLAFGTAHGALRPLTDGEISRSEAVFHDAVWIGGISLTIGGPLGLLGAKNIAKVADEVSQASRLVEQDAVLEIGAQIGRKGNNLPQPAEALIGQGDELLAQVAAGETQQGMNRVGLSARISENVGDLVDSFALRFPGVKRVDRISGDQIHIAGLRLADARMQGSYIARRHADYISRGLSEEESSILVRGLIAARGRQIERDLLGRAAALDAEGVGATIRVNGIKKTAAQLRETVGTVNIGELTQEEAATFSLPHMQAALGRLEKDFLPTLTEIRTRNGLRSLVEGEQPFLPLQAASADDIAQGMNVFVGKGPGATITSGAVRAGANPFTATQTPGARMATGQALGYVADLETVLARTMRTEVALDTKNELIAQIIDSPLSRKLALGERARRTIEVNGKTVKMAEVEFTGNPVVLEQRFGIHLGEGAGPLPGADVPVPAAAVADLAEVGLRSVEGMPIDVGGKVNAVLGRYEVPRPVAKMFAELTDPLQRRGENLLAADFEGPGLQRAFFNFMDFNVGLLLASPVEVTAHSSRILAVLSRIPGVGDLQTGAAPHLAQKFIPWFGPKLGGIRDIFNVYNGKTINIKGIETLTGVQAEVRLSTIPGALPTRALATEVDRGVGRLVGKLPGAAGTGGKTALEAGRKFIFDLPEQQGGFKGFDVRARISAYMALERTTLESLGRRPTDAETFEFINQFGAYTEEIQGNIIAALRRNRTAPFLGGQSTIVPGEIRSTFTGRAIPRSVTDQMTKAASAKLRAETLWRGVLGTAMMLQLAQKATTGTWSWENDAGHELDYNVGQLPDGRKVYIPFNVFAPGVSRAVRITNARTMIETMGVDAVPAIGRNLANLPITYGFGSPGVGALSVLATGNAPFLVGNTTGETTFLRVVPPQPTAPLVMKHRFLEAAGQANPTFEAVFGLDQVGAPSTTIRVINALTPGMKVGPPPDRAATQEIRGIRASVYTISRDRVSQAFRKFGDDVDARFEWYESQAAEFPTDEEREAALRAMMLGDVSQQRSDARNLMRSEDGEPF